MEIPVEFVFANMDGLVLNHQGDGANVMLHRGDAWFADDPFVVGRPELFSTTPLVVFSTVGRSAPPATALTSPAVDAPKVRRPRA
jgi:hypothetical protein